MFATVGGEGGGLRGTRIAGPFADSRAFAAIVKMLDNMFKKERPGGAAFSGISFQS